MAAIPRCLGTVLMFISTVLGLMTFFPSGKCMGASQQLLDWSIRASKDAYYAGEPVLLVLTIKNNGPQQEEVDFGADSIEAFSMEIHNDAGETVVKGGNIRRYDALSRGPVSVPSGQATDRSIVLNQWCSTQLLPVGTYDVMCHVQYRLGSEEQEQPGTIVLKAGPVHTIELKLKISIVQMNLTKFEEILQKLSVPAFPARLWDTGDRGQRDVAREMLTFAESPLAVPYQLKILETLNSTWLKWDAINSLVKSKTRDAASGLVNLADNPRLDDVRRELVKGIYRMRETGKRDIVQATNEFAQTHEPPAQR
jgi:hypothetical protein